MIFKHTLQIFNNVIEKYRTGKASQMILSQHGKKYSVLEPEYARQRQKRCMFLSAVLRKDQILKDQVLYVANCISN